MNELVINCRGYCDINKRFDFPCQCVNGKYKIINDIRNYGDTPYSIQFQINQVDLQTVQAYGQLCLFKSSTPTAPLTPAWVCVVPAMVTTFSWTIQYGILFSSSAYSNGVTLSLSTWQSVNLGDSYELRDDNNFHTTTSCSQSNTICVKNIKSNQDVILGIYSQVNMKSSTTDLTTVTPFYAQQTAHSTGFINVQPLDPINAMVMQAETGELFNAVSGFAQITENFATSTQVCYLFNSKTYTFDSVSC